MQPAHLAVQIAQPGGDAGHVAGALERRLGRAQRLGQRALERHEPALLAAAVRQVEQRLLGDLDLRAAVQLGLGAEGVVDHGLAEIDQLPPQPCVVDRAAVFAGVDDADHRGQQLREIGGAADLLQHAGMLELRLQRHRVGELPGFGAALDRLEDAAVDRVGEVLGQQEFRDALVGLVVGEQRAEQRLFGLQVGRRQTLREAEQRRGERVHRSQPSPPPESCRGRGLWIPADGRASTSLRAPLVAVVVVARWSARSVRFPAGADGVTMRKQGSDESNVVRFPVERRESASIELVSRLAPPRSLVDTLAAEAGLPVHDAVAGMAEEFAHQARSLETGYGRDGAILRLRSLVDALVTHAAEVCRGYQTSADRLIGIEVRAAQAERLSATDRQGLHLARAELRGRAIAARAAADAAIGAASALAIYIRAGLGALPASAVEPRQLLLFGATG